jgi:hypothetical protein
LSSSRASQLTLRVLVVEVLEEVVEEEANLRLLFLESDSRKKQLDFPGEIEIGVKVDLRS